MSLFRAPFRATYVSRLASPSRVCSRRFTSSPRPPAQTASNTQARLDRTFSRLPRFLHRFINPLRAAPLTHITAFLLLHEITALVPLVGLAATFHYANWLPPYITEGAWVRQGVEKFGRYFRRKGWLGEEDTWRWKWWGRGEGGLRVLIEIATAWAIVKALLPVRIILSVWATPWFARISVVPFTNLMRRTLGMRTVKPAASAAAGTGAAGGGVVTKTADRTKKLASGTTADGAKAR